MNLTIIIFKYILVVILDVLQTNMLKSEIIFFGNGLKLYGDKSEPQSKHNTGQLCLCSDKAGVQESRLIKYATRHNSKAIAPRQRSLCKAGVLSAGRLTSASCCNETSGGCVISTYIFQNQNWHDILCAVLINLHATSDISLHCTCWWPCTVNC